MTKARTRTIAATAVATLALTLLAACGSDDEGAPESTSSSSATEDPTTDSSADAGEETPAARGTLLTEDNFTEVMRAALQESESAHMAMRMGSLMSLEGDVSYDGDVTEMAMTLGLGSGDGSGRLVFVDEILYLQMPGMTQEGKWTQLDSSHPTLGTLVDRMTQMGPGGSVELMGDGLEEIEHVGQDRIDGAKVTKYEVTVETAAVASSLGVPEGSSGIPSSVTYDLFVTEDNLIRRMVVEIQGQELVLDVTDWGKDVDIEAPPAGDVVEPTPPS